MNLKSIVEQYADFIESHNIIDSRSFDNISSIDLATESSLVFALNEKFLQQALQSPACCIVTKPQLQNLCVSANKSFIFSTLPDLLVTKILREHFYKSELQQIGQAGIHPNADVDPSAKIGVGSHISAFAVIGKNVQIGQRVYVGANVVIEDSSVIGDDTHIHSLCQISSNSILGKRCIIRSGTVIGAAPTDALIRNQIPKGNCVLEDDVETGSNCCIEYAPEGSTLLKRGCKLDNMVKIGGASILDEDCLITAGVQIGEGAKVGRGLMIGGNSYIEAYTEICERVLVGGMSYVDQNILKPGAYGGNPVQEMRDYLKTTASLAALPKIRKQLSKIDV